MPIDDSLEFVPLGIAVLTVSSTRSLDNDPSGDLLAARIKDAGHRLLQRELVTDSAEAIQHLLQRFIADEETNVVISTGGTGLTGSDSTPEAFEAIYDKAIPGFGELFRMLSYESIGTSTIQSRATAGLAGGTFLFALPGSPGACKDGWDKILRYQLDSRHRPCNFAELIPRLSEEGS